jgi:hypothetical protein
MLKHILSHILNEWLYIFLKKSIMCLTWKKACPLVPPPQNNHFYYIQLKDYLIIRTFSCSHQFHFGFFHSLHVHRVHDENYTIRTSGRIAVLKIMYTLYCILFLITLYSCATRVSIFLVHPRPIPKMTRP